MGLSSTVLGYGISNEYQISNKAICSVTSIERKFLQYRYAMKLKLQYKQLNKLPKLFSWTRALLYKIPLYRLSWFIEISFYGDTDSNIIWSVIHNCNHRHSSPNLLEVKTWAHGFVIVYALCLPSVKRARDQVLRGVSRHSSLQRFGRKAKEKSASTKTQLPMPLQSSPHEWVPEGRAGANVQPRGSCGLLCTFHLGYLLLIC